MVIYNKILKIIENFEFSDNYKSITNNNNNETIVKNNVSFENIENMKNYEVLNQSQNNQNVVYDKNFWIDYNYRIYLQKIDTNGIFTKKLVNLLEEHEEISMK